MFRIRIRIDPFHGGHPEPDPLDPEILENVHKNQPKSQKYHIFLYTYFCLTDINIYLINNITIVIFGEIYFLWQKSKQKVGIFSNLGRIRIRICYSTERIRGSASVSKLN